MLRLLPLFFFLLSVWPLYSQAEGPDEFDREIESFLEEESPKEKEREQEEEDRQEILRSSSTRRGSQRGVVDWANFPRITVVVDMVGDWNVGDKPEHKEGQAPQEDAGSDSANVREAGFGFETAIDHWAYGTVLFAARNENGEYFVELHEASFEFNQLPYDLFLKLGNFYMDVGRLNNRHRHAWKFTKAPLVHEEFFDDEGVADFGGELSFLMPWPFYQELSFGMFNGRTFGHGHDDGVKKPKPLYTGRLKNFFLLGESLGTQLGLSYLRYSVDEDPGNYWVTRGLDLTFKWQRGALQSFEWSTEFWHRKENFAISESTESYGYYSFIEYQPWKMWSFGFRWDHFVRPQDFDARLGKEVDKQDYGQTFSLTHKPSEFSYFRFSLERQDFYAKQDDYVFMIQADFMLGYHKPHVY